MNREQLKHIRLRLKMTQTDLARALGVRPATVSHWEQGVTRITERTEAQVRSIEKLMGGK